MNTAETFVAPSTPVDLRSVPCFFYPITGIEDTESQRVLSIDRVMFDFARGTPITRRDRIKYLDEIYEIVHVTPVGGGHHIAVEAKQIEI